MGHYLRVSTQAVEFTVGSKWQPWGQVWGTHPQAHCFSLVLKITVLPPWHSGGCFNTIFK